MLLHLVCEYRLHPNLVQSLFHGMCRRCLALKDGMVTCHCGIFQNVFWLCYVFVLLCLHHAYFHAMAFFLKADVIKSSKFRISFLTNVFAFFAGSCKNTATVTICFVQLACNCNVFRIVFFFASSMNSIFSMLLFFMMAFVTCLTGWDFVPLAEIIIPSILLCLTIDSDSQ